MVDWPEKPWRGWIMELVLLGTSGYHPSETRHTACLALPEIGVVLDAGSSMFRLPPYLRRDTLDIFLTHAHLDHVIGLTYLLGILHRHPLQRVTVHGEAEKLAAIEEHLFSELLFPVRPSFELRPLEHETTLSDGGRLTWFPLAHPGGSVGYRLDWPDRSMAYVTDTTATADAGYRSAIQDADLLLHECYFPDALAEHAEPTGHSSTSQVAQLAMDCGVKKLVLMHIDPWADPEDPIGLSDALALFPETIVGHDGLCLEI